MHKALYIVKEQIRGFLHIIEREDIFAVLLIIFVGFASFGLGRLSVLENSQPEITIEKTTLGSRESAASFAAVQGQEESIPGEGAVVASRSGKAYHYPWCSGAKRIKEENKITFSTIAEARSAGYEPAKNCKGLE